jgi:hypothetical protein
MLLVRRGRTIVATLPPAADDVDCADRSHDEHEGEHTQDRVVGAHHVLLVDRTGHRSSQIVNRYRRVARTVAEARLGDLAPWGTPSPSLQLQK